MEHDYLKDGFVSQSKEEELPVPGLTVRYLRETVDVSDRINSQIASIKEEHRVWPQPTRSGRRWPIL